MKIEKIIIDPGHGGNDNGAVWGFEEEDDINLAVGLFLSYELGDTGFRPMLTRSTDRFVSLKSRTKLANDFEADLFVSIHCDAFHNTSASGMSTHVFPGSEWSHRFAGFVHSQLVARFPDHRDRGVRQSDFYVLRETVCPAVLVECEFISNPEARDFLKEPGNQREIARAIARGIRAAAASLA